MAISGSDPLVIDNSNRVVLTASIVEDELSVVHGEHRLHDFAGTLVDRIDGSSAVELVLEGFEHAGKGFQVYGFSPGDGGALEAWPRGDDGTSTTSLALADGQDSAVLSFVVVAVRDDGQEVYADDYPIVRVDRMGSGGSL